MKRHRHTPEQIVRKLREGDRLLNEGKDIAEVLRHLEIARAPGTAGGPSTAA
jgi:putative transposase